MSATEQAPKPTALEVRPEGIPAELRALPRWVLWRWWWTGSKWTKPPYQPDGTNASTTDSATWVAFEYAIAVYLGGGFDGIGFVLTDDDDLAGVDLDHVVDPETGSIEPGALGIVTRIDSFTELSPSGTGLRCVVHAPHAPRVGRKLGRTEMYSTGRYLTFTGHRLEALPATIEHRDAEYLAEHARAFPPKPAPERQPASGAQTLSDAEVIARAVSARNGAKVSALLTGDDSLHGGDVSAADLALLASLAFWTQDAAQLDRLFRTSGRMRPKWDDRHSGDGRTYGAMTVDTALASVGETWSGEHHEPRGDGGLHEPLGDDVHHGGKASADVLRELQRLRVQDEARRLLAAEKRGTTEPPEVLTLSERLARPTPPARYRIRDWQPAGARVMLAAQYKAGKTTLLGNLIRCLVDGAHWLGVADVETVTGTVVLFDCEMAPRQLDEWLGDQQIIHPEKVIVVPLRGRLGAFNILDDAVRTEWAATLRELNAEYVALDCLRPLMDALGLDENHDAGRLLVAFDALLAEARVADACVVHHMGHGQERARGDSRIRDWPDVEWRLVRESEEPSSRRYITAFGRDVDVFEKSLAYDPYSRRLSIAGGSRKDAAAEEALSAVLALLGETKEPMSGNAIEKALTADGIPRGALRNALKNTVKLARSKGKRNATLYSPAGEFASSPQFATTSPAKSEHLASSPIARRTQDEHSGESVRRVEDEAMSVNGTIKREEWTA